MRCHYSRNVGCVTHTLKDLAFRGRYTLNDFIFFTVTDERRPSVPKSLVVAPWDGSKDGRRRRLATTMTCVNHLTM